MHFVQVGEVRVAWMLAVVHFVADGGIGNHER
jgi:hypothetical protein